MSVRTYADACVLITAALAKDEALANRALAVLDDPSREYIGSDFLRLEVLPKAVDAERAFYEEYFAACSTWVSPSEDLVSQAIAESSGTGLKPLDALHVASAVEGDAHELVTFEKPSSPFFKSTALTITTLYMPE